MISRSLPAPSIGSPTPLLKAQSQRALRRSSTVRWYFLILTIVLDLDGDNTTDPPELGQPGTEPVRGRLRDTQAPAVVHQEGALPAGAVIFEVRLDQPVPAAVFQRHADDDPLQAVPAIEFLDHVPTKVAAEVHAVLSAVAEAPPPAFSGGGKWEAMHGELVGLYEIRVQAAARITGCSASWPAPTISGDLASCVWGACRSRLARQPMTATTVASSCTPLSSRDVGRFWSSRRSTSGGRSALHRSEIEPKSFRYSH